MNIRIFSPFQYLAIMGILVACLATPALAADNWEVSTVSEDISHYPAASVAFGPDNVPHIAYYDHGFFSSNILHSWRSGGTWNTETVGPSAGTCTTSVAISPDGNPSVSFGDGLHFGNLMFASRNASSWERSIVARGSMGDAGQYSSLAFDRLGNPHIAYNDGQHYASLYYASLNRTNGKWELSLIDDDIPYFGDAGYSPSLKIDAAGRPHVAYTVDGPSPIADDRRDRPINPLSLGYATSRDGINWTATKQDWLDPRSFESLDDKGVSLALDSRGYPHISYYCNKTLSHNAPIPLRYLSWDGIGWTRETVAMPAKRDFGPSLAIDAQDVPHIAYCDVAERSLKYATRSPDGVWSIQTIDQGNVLRMPFLALSPAGRPGIAYYDMTSHSLKFAQG
jgi:hypothetical protein